MDLYFPLFLIGFFTYILWYYSYSKYIVVSENIRSNIKVHTKPVSYADAIKKQRILKEQYNNQTLSGYSCKSQVFLVRFDKI